MSVMLADSLLVIDAECGAVAVPGASGRKLSICLINPRFEPSYWGFDFALPMYPGNKRSTMISGALSALAGMCGDHDVVLVDENVEEIDWESMARFDIVGVTGMIVQKDRMREIFERLAPLPPMTVVGGPLVSVDEAFFAGLCDVRFIGEAETTWPGFLHDIAHGIHHVGVVAVTALHAVVAGAAVEAVVTVPANQRVVAGQGKQQVVPCQSMQRVGGKRAR
jgi:hypothetical protein